MFCFQSWLHKAIEHLVQPTYASPVTTECTGAHNAGAPSNNLDQLPFRKISLPVSQTSPVQESAENDGDDEDWSEENQSFEVQLFFFFFFFCFNKGEAVNGSSSSHPVRGRLKAHISFWQSLEAPDFILSTIRDGYNIPYLSTPPRFWYKNNYCSSLENCTFVTKAIQELIQDGNISEVHSSDLSNINPLSISIHPCGNKRLMLDLRFINQHPYKFKFKYEDYKKAVEYFKPGSRLKYYPLVTFLLNC